tara:strand:+ start:211 stop:411 length:201 start_codon:yes stop_codon:yes gene_type:complete
MVSGIWYLVSGTQHNANTETKNVWGNPREDFPSDMLLDLLKLGVSIDKIKEIFDIDYEHLEFKEKI